MLPHLSIRAASIVAITTRSSLSQNGLAFVPNSIHSYGTTRLFSTPPSRYLLSYDYVPDVLEKRGPHREGHIELAKKMIEDGLCISGGPSLPPGKNIPSGALFIFTTKEAAEKFVTQDPYVSNGIVTGHSILEWNVVVGNN